MSENLSRYFENTASPSVFDTILPPDAAQNVKVNVAAQENTIPDVPDAIRDLWIRPDPDAAAVTMLTSPGILSNNDLVCQHHNSIYRIIKNP